MKKFFALVTITSLTGFVAAATAAGCSSDTIVEPSAAADGSTATDSGKGGAKVDTQGGNPEEEDTSTPPEEACIVPDFTWDEKEAESVAKGKWAPAILAKGACTDTEIAKFGTNLDEADGTTPMEDLVAGVSAGCKTCLFSTSTDNHWQIVVGIPGTDKTAGFINYGACHGAETASAACGKNYQYNQFCVNTACANCETDEADEKCVETVWGTKDGACVSVDQATETECGDILNSECGDEATTHAAFLCGGKVTTDSGIKDAANDG